MNTGEFLSTKTAVDHNLYCLNIKGKNICFEANYSAGLRIIDASRISEGKLEVSGLRSGGSDTPNRFFHAGNRVL